MRGLTANKPLPAVLLIDDDMVSREVLATLLTMGGLSVHTAADGRTALELLTQGSCAPDAILMDARMPGLSGRDLIVELRKLSRAVVVAMSGSDVPADIAAAADGFLLKPFGVEELARLLERREAQKRPEVEANEPGEPVVKAETLAQLRAMMPEKGVRQIYAVVVADLDQRMAALEAAIGRGDLAEVGRIGHAIKGGCAMAGAAQAARLGERLETAGAEAWGNELDNSRQLLKELRTAHRNLERMLEAEFPAQTQGMGG